METLILKIASSDKLVHEDRKLFAKLIAVALLTGGIFINHQLTAAAQSGPSNGQVSSAPSVVGSAGSPAGATNPSTMTTSASKPVSPITTPVTTVGNTPSSLGASGQSSGYSSGGTTVNGNINNANVGGRSMGMPIGSGSQTTTGPRVTK